VDDAQKKLADALMRAAGATLWLDDESQMDAVTALSGSGPAYVFLFMELFIKAGIAHGLTEEMAKKLVMQTMRGSVKLAMKSSESLEQLRKNVTSPGGTTEAALDVLMKDEALQRLMDKAVKAAVKRAGEL
jgi:pyrroline-5-carboxylate reductase